MIDFYDNVFNLKRAVSFVIRMVNKILRPKGAHILKGQVTSSELFLAECLIINTVQKRAFPQLIEQLKNYATAEEAMGDKSTPYVYKGELKKLHPILVKGILRVGGRLIYSVLSEDAKHPIILPKDSNFTNLIIDSYHGENAHMGAHITLSSVRQRFLIIHGLHTTKKGSINV